MYRKNKKRGQGFTLIELLVVIAIIAILSVVVILTLNPAELLRQSRDSNRISDMSVLKSAIGYYLATASSISIGTSTCYESAPFGQGTSTAACLIFFHSAASSATESSTAVDGTGWLPVPFSTLTGGSPVGALPQDPLIGANTFDKTHLYAYIASSSQLTFKLDAHMESQKYNTGGGSDVCTNDGGVDANSYEQGTNLAL